MISELFTALHAGSSLSDPASWKKGQELTNLIGAVLAGVITLIRWKYPDFLLPEGATQYAAEMIGSVLVLVNLYLTRATTKKSIGGAGLPASIEVEGASQK